MHNRNVYFLDNDDSPLPLSSPFPIFPQPLPVFVVIGCYIGRHIVQFYTFMSQPHGHIFKLAAVCWLCISSLMESSTVHEIMSQLKLLTDGMASVDSVRQDVGMLKCVNSVQPNTFEEIVNRDVDDTANRSFLLRNQLISNQNSLWVEEWATGIHC